MPKQKTRTLIAQKGIAEMYGFKSNTISNWIRRWPDFPKPVMLMGRNKLYDRAEVEAWMQLNTEYEIVREPSATYPG